MVKYSYFTALQSMGLRHAFVTQTIDGERHLWSAHASFDDAEDQNDKLLSSKAWQFGVTIERWDYGELHSSSRYLGTEGSSSTNEPLWETIKQGRN